jgi:hypothetical protein
VTLECAGNGRALMKDRAISQPWLVEAVSTATWTGTPLKALLLKAGLRPGAVEMLFRGADEGVQGEEKQFYERSLSLAEALHDDVLLAYEMIEVLDRAFEGFQMRHSYRYSQSAEDAGEPVDRIRVRALMIPPGIPDFMTRARLLPAGPVTIYGRAWAGRTAVARVELSGDGGESWQDAVLAEPVSAYAWRGWSAQWQATPGLHVLCARATDAGGAVQPAEQWNYYGMGNNMVQRVEVLVE